MKTVMGALAAVLVGSLFAYAASTACIRYLAARTTEEQNDLLDAAGEDSFPASDPPSTSGAHC